VVGGLISLCVNAVEAMKVNKHSLYVPGRRSLGDTLACMPEHVATLSGFGTRSVFDFVAYSCMKHLQRIKIFPTLLWLQEATDQAELHAKIFILRSVIAS